LGSGAEKHHAAIVGMSGPLGKTKKVSGCGIEDISNLMSTYIHPQPHEIPMDSIVTERILNASFSQKAPENHGPIVQICVRSAVGFSAEAVFSGIMRLLVCLDWS
jgi:hypothetical protein